MLRWHADPEREAVEAGAPVDVETAAAAGEEALVRPARARQDRPVEAEGDQSDIAAVRALEISFVEKISFVSVNMSIEWFRVAEDTGSEGSAKAADKQREKLARLHAQELRAAAAASSFQRAFVTGSQYSMSQSSASTCRPTWMILKTVSSPVKGLRPLRSLVAGLRWTTILQRPGIEKLPGPPRFAIALRISSLRASITSPTCFLDRSVASAMLFKISVLVGAFFAVAFAMRMTLLVRSKTI